MKSLWMFYCFIDLESVWSSFAIFSFSSVNWFVLLYSAIEQCQTLEQRNEKKTALTAFGFKTNILHHGVEDVKLPMEVIETLCECNYCGKQPKSNQSLAFYA